MTPLRRAINQLKACVDDDGHLHLDRQQTRYLFFLLYDIADGSGIEFAIADLLGTLPSEREESA